MLVLELMKKAPNLSNTIWIVCLDVYTPIPKDHIAEFSQM